MMKRWIERLEGRIREKRPGTGLPDSGCEELIKIVNLCKVYDTGTMKVIGLRNINLTIRRGEFVAIMGQSGSGKSTFMNILGCLDRPAIGHYYLDGIDINAMDDDQLSLGARTEHMPNEMSGGQRQRVAIARALANDPPLILADEPTGNLDTASSIEIMELFSELHREGATVVVVTHEEDIASFTQRIIRFRDGQIISDEKNEAWKCREGRKTDAD